MDASKILPWLGLGIAGYLGYLFIQNQAAASQNSGDNSSQPLMVYGGGSTSGWIPSDTSQVSTAPQVDTSGLISAQSSIANNTLGSSDFQAGLQAQTSRTALDNQLELANINAMSMNSALTTANQINAVNTLAGKLIASPNSKNTLQLSGFGSSNLSIAIGNETPGYNAPPPSSYSAPSRPSYSQDQISMASALTASGLPGTVAAVNYIQSQGITGARLQTALKRNYQDLAGQLIKINAAGSPSIH